MECDPSIKAIILKIDQDKHDYIVEDLDDQTLMVKETQLPKLKARLEEVRRCSLRPPEALHDWWLLIRWTGTGEYPADA